MDPEARAARDWYIFCVRTCHNTLTGGFFFSCTLCGLLKISGAVDICSRSKMQRSVYKMVAKSRLDCPKSLGRTWQKRMHATQWTISWHLELNYYSFLRSACDKILSIWALSNCCLENKLLLNPPCVYWDTAGNQTAAFILFLSYLLLKDRRVNFCLAPLYLPREDILY